MTTAESARSFCRGTNVGAGERAGLERAAAARPFFLGRGFRYCATSSSESQSVSIGGDSWSGANRSARFWMLGNGGCSGDKNGASLSGAIDVLAEPPPTALARVTMPFIWPYHDHPLVTLACAAHHGVGGGLRISGPCVSTAAAGRLRFVAEREPVLALASCACLRFRTSLSGSSFEDSDDDELASASQAALVDRRKEHDWSSAAAVAVRGTV